MSLYRNGSGWLFAEQSPNGVYHAGFSRSDNTLCGVRSIGWTESSLTPGRTYCVKCWRKALAHFPELKEAK